MVPEPSCLYTHIIPRASPGDGRGLGLGWEGRKLCYQASLRSPTWCQNHLPFTHTQNTQSQPQNSPVKMGCRYPYFTADNAEASSAGETCPKSYQKQVVPRSIWFQNPNSYPSHHWQECTGGRSHLDPSLSYLPPSAHTVPPPSTAFLLYPSPVQSMACFFQEVLPDVWQPNLWCLHPPSSLVVQFTILILDFGAMRPRHRH